MGQTPRMELGMLRGKACFTSKKQRDATRRALVPQEGWTRVGSRALIPYRQEGTVPHWMLRLAPGRQQGTGCRLPLLLALKFHRISHLQPFLQHLRKWGFVSSLSLLQIIQSASLHPGSGSLLDANPHN